MQVEEECSGDGDVPWGGLTGDGHRPWWLGGAGLTLAVLHRDLSYLLATTKGREGAWGLTGHSNQLETQRRRRREGGADGVGELLNWRKVEEEGKRRGNGKRRGRWGVLALGRAGGGEGEARASPAGPI